ncbi:Putative exported protein [Moritella viscosa]|nr:Putative exported protein [Moritella viscosa]
MIIGLHTGVKMMKQFLLMLCLITTGAQAADFTTHPTRTKYTYEERRAFDKKDVRRLYYFLENAYALNTPKKAVLDAYFQGVQSAMEIHKKMQDDFNLRHQTGYQDSFLCLPDEFALSPKLHPNLLLNATIDTYKKARWWSDDHGVYRIMLWMGFNEIARQYECKPPEEIKPFNPVAPDGDWKETKVTPTPALAITDPNAVPLREYYKPISTMAAYMELRNAPDSLRKRRFDAFLLGAQDGLNRSNSFMLGILEKNQKPENRSFIGNGPDKNHLTWLCANSSDLSTLTAYGNTKKKLFPRILDKMYNIKPAFYKEGMGEYIPMLSVIVYELQEQFKCDNDIGYVAVPDIKDIYGKQFQLKVPALLGQFID